MSENKKNTVPNITNTEVLIMNVLLDKSNSEIYGWELMDASNGSLKRGTIYVILNRMEEKGLIISRKEVRRKGERGLPRRMYKLTGHGYTTISALEAYRNSFGVII